MYSLSGIVFQRIKLSLYFADIYIPASGKICLVDTARDGLRVKVGDGITVWKDLKYADEFIIKGYYHEGTFYKDEQYTIPISGVSHKIFL